MGTLDRFLELFHRIVTAPVFELGDNIFTIQSFSKFLLLIVLVFVGERLFQRHVMIRVLRRTHLSVSMQFALARIVGYVVITIGLYISLKLVGIDLSSLAIIAGAVGVGIGFGLQNIVSNFVSGIIILAERPIAIGDRVEVNGITGQVLHIRLRSTVIVTNDNISVIVPNSNFISNPVVNWSYGDLKVRINLPVGVAYGTDPEKVRQLLTEVGLAHRAVLREPPPSVFFIGFGESSLDFELGVWTAEMVQNPKRFRSELYFEIEKTLRTHGVEIPFPQRDLHLRSGQLPVHLEKPTPVSRT